MENKNQVQVSFLATDKYIEDNIISPKEIEKKPGEMVYWGTSNDYPNYIEDLYLEVSTLKSIIDGSVDYICGDEIIDNIKLINTKGHSIGDIVKYVAKDLVKYGGFALNVIRNKVGGIANIYYIDFKKLRSNKDNTIFYYTEKWDRSYGRLKYTEIPSFFSSDEPSTIFYYKNDLNYTYPVAPIAAAIKSCEIERLINNYHLNNIVNGFNSSYIINFNSGKPTDEQKAEIERNFYNKFLGPNNASRPMLSFNNSKVQETTVTKIDKDDLDQKYTSLVDHSKQDIFTSFRCSPILFGIDQEKTGFNANEYKETFKLFNKTFIQPKQDIIIKSLNKIFGTDNTIEIKPFNIVFEEDEQKNQI